MEKIVLPRGTQDALPDLSLKLSYVESMLRQLGSLYGFNEIRTPIFEHTQLFQRSVGESSDIVNKEMYTFLDRSERSLTLRPEGTAGAIRAFIEHKLHTEDLPVKLFYSGPVFRYERPQHGRYRQFTQFGYESIGVQSPFLDVEVITLAVTSLYMLGLREMKVKINSIGDDETRASYREALKKHFQPHLSTLCPDCQRRYEQNPLRILDCKVDKEHPGLISAPSIRDFLSPSAKDYFNQVLKLLSEYNIPYELDDHLVRGLDYYTHTIFEIMIDNPVTAELGAIAAGGRYDHLVSDLGGPDMPAVGFAFGVERLVMAMEEFHLFEGFKPTIDVYVMPLEEMANSYAFEIVMYLRSNGIRIEMDYLNRSIKSQFKTSEKNGAKITLLVGPDEVASKTVTLKIQESKEQFTISASELLHKVDELLHSHDHDHDHDHDHEHGDHDHHHHHKDGEECGCGGECDGECGGECDGEDCNCTHDHEHEDHEDGDGATGVFSK